MPNKPHNQGEGDRESDRRYRENARQFVDSGRVAGAAAEAEGALDTDEASSLERAARAGKARSAGEDRLEAREPLPTWWSEREHGVWDRVKDALHRDWLQTKSNFGLPGGVDLDQDAKTTMKQAAGKLPMPGVSPALGWDLARHAVRLGFGAATYYIDHRVWNEELEAELAREWIGMDVDVPWTEARSLVRYGWERGRSDVDTGRH